MQRGEALAPVDAGRRREATVSIAQASRPEIGSVLSPN
jgi:hypothetical protein